jgi:hypothetical protein
LYQIFAFYIYGFGYSFSFTCFHCWSMLSVWNVHIPVFSVVWYFLCHSFYSLILTWFHHMIDDMDFKIKLLAVYVFKIKFLSRLNALRTLNYLLVNFFAAYSICNTEYVWCLCRCKLGCLTSRIHVLRIYCYSVCRLPCTSFHNLKALWLFICFIIKKL